jgi:putative chitinase
MNVTVDQLKSLFPSSPTSTLQLYVDPFNLTLDKYDINTSARISMFLAQIGEESGGFTITEENMNYSAGRLLQVFPRYFQNIDANSYAHNPEKLANYVYGNRMGNGGPATGDGYRFRGGGFIQLTGRENYTSFAKDQNISAEDAAAYVRTSEGACESAGWFWNKHNLNDVADQGDVLKATQIINGGTNGLDRRQQLYDLATTIFL